MADSSLKGLSQSLAACCNVSHWISSKADTPNHSRRSLWVMVALLTALWVMELLAGWSSHSLSLLADAGHLLSDLGAIFISLIAAWLAQRPAPARATFGNRRIEAIAALLNSGSLVIVALWIAQEALTRIQSPQPVYGLPMLVVAAVGFGVNMINALLLWRSGGQDLNLRGVLLHVLADAASSLGVILAAMAIYFGHCLWVDAVVSLMIAIVVGISALPLCRECLEILLNYAPRGVEPTQVEAALASFPGVYQVEKLRIWAMSSQEVALCAHLTIDGVTGGERDRLLKQLQSYLTESFGITDSTLQLTSRYSVETQALHPLLESAWQWSGVAQSSAQDLEKIESSIGEI